MEAYLIRFIQKIQNLLTKSYIAPLILGLIIIGVYYKLFLLGKIPFPGDLLVASYSPWFDYYKIPVQNPLISDVFSLLFIWKYLAIDQIKNFAWPLWNPYSFAGTPLLANYQSAALYPFNLLLLLPKFLGWGLFIFFQTLLAALGMYLLLSCWLHSKLAKLTGSIIFALGGLMTTWVEFGTAVWTISYLPISLFLIERFANTRKMRYPLILSLILSLTILAGNPQATVYSLAIVAIFAIIRLARDRLLILLAIALAITLTAPQLLTSFELVQKSIRTTESYITESNFGLLPIRDFLRFFVADFFGNPVTANYWGFLNYFETSSFVGSLTLPLIIFAVYFLKKNRITYFFFYLAIISIILSFNNPLSYFLYSFRIPFLTQSYASRMLFITTFALSILSAFALNQIKIKREEDNNFLRCIIWSWAFFSGILLGTILAYKMTGGYQPMNSIVALRNSLLPFIEISMLLVIFIIVSTINFSFIRKYYLSIVCLFLFVLLTFDLCRYFLKFNPFVSEKFIFPQTPALEFLQKHTGEFRIGREHAEVLPPNTWAAYKLQSFEGYDVLHLLDFSKIVNHINGGNLLLSRASRYEELINYKSPFIDAAGIKYFMAIGRDKNRDIPGNFIDSQLEKTNYKRVFKDHSAVILENPNALPKVYFVTSFLVASQSQIENIITYNSAFNPKTTAALSTNLDIKTVTGKGSAEITSYTPGQVKITTETNQDEIMILADQYEDGWKAEIDGNNTKISRANLIFRAIKIPSGTHKIVFNYYPESFNIGLKITLTSLLAIIIMSLIFMKTHKF